MTTGKNKPEDAIENTSPQKGCGDAKQSDEKPIAERGIIRRRVKVHTRMHLKMNLPCRQRPRSEYCWDAAKQAPEQNVAPTKGLHLKRV